MAKLPSAADLGNAPIADASMPVGSYDATPVAQGGAALAKSGQMLAQGLGQAGAGFASEDIDQARWQFATQRAALLSGIADVDSQTAQATNPGADASGQPLVNRHAEAVWKLQDSAAAGITNPGMRERFMLSTGPLVQRSIARAEEHATTLQHNIDIAGVENRGNDLATKAIGAPDDATRRDMVDAYSGLVDGLVTKGAINPVQAFAMKQRWAQEYATGDLMHRATTDPQGVINELRAAPGSGADITNRIVANEGTAQNPNSSASGVGQFTDPTWLSTIKQARPDLAAGKTDQQLLALRADKGLAWQMTDYLRQQNEGALKQAGVAVTPGHDYLAHFLGPKGAIAVAEADPSAPVEDVLTKAVGAQKAAEMIAANPSVLKGQLAGSVAHWADGKMGGAVPGAGSIYDLVRPDVREEIVAKAQGQIEKQQIADRAAFQLRVSNATSEAFADGAPSQPIGEQEFIAHYGADQGPVRFQQYQVQLQEGRTINAMKTMDPASRQRVVDSLKPAAGDPDFALKEKAYEIAQRASAGIDAAIAKDPAGYAVSRLGASKQAYADLTQALSGGTEADQANAARAYAAVTLDDQARVGVAPAMQRVVPQSYVSNLQGILQKSATSDDPNARIALIGRIHQEAQMWGQYWPQVMRELSPKVQPTVRAIAAGADPNAMTRILSLPPGTTTAKLIGEQSAVSSKQLNDAVNTAMAPLAKTMVGDQMATGYPGWHDLAVKLAATYVRDGDGASNAATKAFNALVGDRYEFHDSWRLPKSAGVNGDDVVAGAAAARAMIAGDEDAGGSEGSGLTPQQIMERNASYVRAGASNFQTQLSSAQEKQFEGWVAKNHVPFDPTDKTADYDMRGFWKALQSGDPRAKQAVDPNDGKMHFPDYWKTPYDLTFSRQSQYANANAPDWKGDQLVLPSGKVVYDDKHRPGAFGVVPPINDIPGRSNPTATDLGLLARDGKWVTAPDNSGLMLAYNGVFARTHGGKPLVLPWQRLAQLGKQDPSSGGGWAGSLGGAFLGSVGGKP